MNHKLQVLYYRTYTSFRKLLFEKSEDLNPLATQQCNKQNFLWSVTHCRLRSHCNAASKLPKPQRDWATTGATAVWFATKRSPFLTSCWCRCSGCSLSKWKMQQSPRRGAHVARCTESFLQLISASRREKNRRGLEKSHRRSRPSLPRMLWTCLGDGDVGPTANTIFIILVVPAVDTNNV